MNFDDDDDDDLADLFTVKLWWFLINALRNSTILSTNSSHDKEKKRKTGIQNETHNKIQFQAINSEFHTRFDA